jgi:hypothetical protein
VILAARPPEYFPRLEYAALMLLVDRFVLADTLPYSRQSTQNRCRVRLPGPGERASAWLSVPLLGGTPGRPITKVEIAPDPRWRQVHRKTLLHHYSSAPFFVHYRRELEELIAFPTKNLGALTTATTQWVATVLRARAELIPASELPGKPDTLEDMLRRSRAQALTTLPESALRDREAAEAAAAELQVLNFRERPRRQNFPGFTPGCSVLDLILNHGPGSAAYLLECIGEEAA